jgi:hypothetical protein
MAPRSKPDAVRTGSPGSAPLITLQSCQGPHLPGAGRSRCRNRRTWLPRPRAASPEMAQQPGRDVPRPPPQMAAGALTRLSDAGCCPRWPRCRDASNSARFFCESRCRVNGGVRFPIAEDSSGISAGSPGLETGLAGLHPPGGFRANREKNRESRQKSVGKRINARKLRGIPFRFPARETGDGSKENREGLAPEHGRM